MKSPYELALSFKLKGLFYDYLLVKYHSIKLSYYILKRRYNKPLHYFKKGDVILSVFLTYSILKYITYYLTESVLD